MPRQVAPPPSGEFAIHLTKPFSGTPTLSIEVIGEPNRPAVVRRSNYTGGNKSNEKSGDVPKDDVDELMSLMETVRGLPSHPNTDIYGADTKLDLTTFEIQWTNKEEDPTMATDITEIAAEQKDDFKRVADSIEALAREFAKQDSAI